jgi:predicted RNA methylase
MKQRLKRALLPGAGARTIPLGLCRGLRLEIDFEHETLFYLGLYEVEIARHVRNLCRPGMTTYDVGGQHGWHALAFAKLGAKVTTFEPDPGALERMRRNLALNPELAVEVSDRFVGFSDLRLDSLPAPGFLKVDVDGGELDVLRSAGDTLREVPGLIVETHSHDLERACGEVMREQGFAVTVVDNRKVLREYRPIAHNRWLVGRRPCRS